VLVFLHLFAFLLLLGNYFNNCFPLFCRFFNLTLIFISFLNCWFSYQLHFDLVSCVPLFVPFLHSCYCLGTILTTASPFFAGSSLQFYFNIHFFSQLVVQLSTSICSCELCCSFCTFFAFLLLLGNYFNNCFPLFCRFFTSSQL
jgi:hypothetical protein